MEMVQRRLQHCGWLILGKESESGQALVELSFSVIFLMLIMLVAVEFARVTYAAIEVSNAARAAIQFGAMNGGPGADTTSGPASLANAAQADSVNLGTTVLISAGYPIITNACSGGGTYNAATTSCPSPQKVMETMAVGTYTDYKPLIGIPGFPKTYRLYGFAKELVLQ